MAVAIRNVGRPSRPRERRSEVLTPVQKGIIVGFRLRTLLPLDDVGGCLRDGIPKLTRSDLHRCLERYGISRLPATQDGPGVTPSWNVPFVQS